MNDTPAPTSAKLDLAAALFALTFPTLVTWVYFVLLADAPAAVQQLNYSAGKAIQFAFPLVWVLIVQRQRLCWNWTMPAGLPSAAGFGVLVTTAMLVVYHLYLKPAGFFTDAAEAVARKVEGFGFDSLAKYATLGLFYSACHSFLEEYYWRWFVFAQLRRLVSLRANTVLSCLNKTKYASGSATRPGT